MMSGLKGAARKRAAARLAVRVIGAVAWFAAWISSIWIYSVTWSRMPDLKLVAFVLLVSVCGIFIFGLPALIFRRTVDGVITEREVTDAFAPFTRGGDDDSTRQMQILTVELDDRRKLRIKCPNREVFIEAFAPGVRVRRHRLLIIPEPLDGKYAGRLCLVCGGVRGDDGKCGLCGRDV